MENKFMPGNHGYHWDFKTFRQYTETDGGVVAEKNIRRIMMFQPRAAAPTERSAASAE